MKNFIAVFLIFVAGMAYAGGGSLTLKEKAPHAEMKMKDVSGVEFSLMDLKKHNGIVVIFSCNGCPFVHAWEGRYNGIYQLAKENNIGMAVLNSNYMKRDGDDSFDAMQKHAKDMGYLFPYLMDTESLLANSFGAQTTPHVFLFDKDFNLVYKGAIDDNFKSADEVASAYLNDAIKSLAKNEKIAVAETKPTGCSIKRKAE